MIDKGALMATGRWRFTRRTPDGPQVGAWRNNTIQYNLYAVAQALLVAEPGYQGWQYLAFGSGSSSWDGLTNAPPAPPDAGNLLDEFARIPLSAHHYIDERGNIVTTVTRTIQLQATIDGAALGETLTTPRSYRELALVGGTATAALGSGLTLAVLRIPREVRYEGDDPVIVTIEIEI
jgi:hypothetical protein